MKINPQICLILLLTGCGRGAVPQTTPQVVNTRDTIIIAPEAGDDCTQYADAIDQARAALYKCEGEINGLLDENAELKAELDKPCRKRKKDTTIKAKNGSTIIVNSIVDSSVIKSDKGKDKAKDAGATGDGNAVTQTKECKDRFWLGVLVATAVFQALRVAKKYAALAPPPFGAILSKILNFIA